jgi:hypothetical protein
MNTMRLFILALIFTPVLAQGAATLNSFLLPGRPSILLLIAGLFYFGYKWRAR